MTLETVVEQSTSKLSLAGLESARLDSLILLEDELKRDRAWILAHGEYLMSGELVRNFLTKLERRAKHEPLAYIRKSAEFYGRSYYVNHHVLTPRPESESMISLLVEVLKYGRPLAPDSTHKPLPRRPRIVDVGTGSGVLAITAELEVPRAEVLGVDIDSECLEVAIKNSRKHKTKVNFLNGDLLRPLFTRSFGFDVILANLPYVPSRMQINQAASHEPELAIFGGGDGMEIYRRMFNQINEIPNKPRLIITESLSSQHFNLADIAALAGYALRRTDGLAQLFELREYY